MGDLYLIKLGGGSITDQEKPRVAKRGEIKRLLTEIYEAKKEKGFDVIIGHGSGSFGHVTAKEYRVNEGLINADSRKGALMTMVVASELDFIVIDVALELGIPLFPFFPSSFAFAENKKLKDGCIDALSNALKGGFIPLVHGDVVVDAKQGICIASTEEVFRFVAERMPPKKVILVTDVDGIYDKDPRVYSDAKFVETVTSDNAEELMSGADGAHKVDVTGGMKTKIALLYEMVKKSGATGYIANSQKPGVLKSLLLGDESVKHTEVTCD